MLKKLFAVVLFTSFVAPVIAATETASREGEHVIQSTPCKNIAEGKSVVIKSDDGQGVTLTCHHWLSQH